MEKTYKEIALEREDEEQEQYLTEWRKNHCTRTKKVKCYNKVVTEVANKI